MVDNTWFCGERWVLEKGSRLSFNWHALFLFLFEHNLIMIQICSHYDEWQLCASRKHVFLWEGMHAFCRCIFLSQDDVMKWKYVPRYWPFVRGILWSPVNSPHKGQWRVALMFSLICAWINSWVNNREAGDLRRHRAHYGVIVMQNRVSVGWISWACLSICIHFRTYKRLVKGISKANTFSVTITVWYRNHRQDFKLWNDMTYLDLSANKYIS